jgi:pimeloyl-ACP methyl ester carboxylesterase
MDIAAGLRVLTQAPYSIRRGGPGFESPRVSETGGWVKAATENKFRVLLLDQRGTGLSTPLSPPALASLPTAVAVSLLTHFRADAIVNDCEAIRSALGVTKWSLLGQSFGGFCSCTYLSFHQEALKEALITGGLAPCPALRCPEAVDTVYAALYPRVATQTHKYYSRFPEDVAAVQRIVLHLADAPGGGVDLPSGGRLTPRGLQLLGWGLGSSGGFEALHYLLERAWDSDLAALAAGRAEKASKMSLAFLKGFEATLPFDSNPLYALIHEACYANGGATRWAAQRALDADPTRAAAFDPVAAAREGRPVPLTGEMVFPFMFDDIASLRPLRTVADALAEHEWPATLYNVDMLRQNSVPAAATAYFEDLYVDCNLALETAAVIKGLRPWVRSPLWISRLVCTC